MSNRLSSLHHVGIVVRDLEESASWYERHLGFERAYDYAFPGARVMFIARGDIRLELFQTEGAVPMASERERAETNLKIGGINHLAITVDDLDATLEDLKAKGVDLVSPPRDVPDGQGDRFAFIRDNEGMLIELFHPGAIWQRPEHQAATAG